MVQFRPLSVRVGMVAANTVWVVDKSARTGRAQRKHAAASGGEYRLHAIRSILGGVAFLVFLSALAMKLAQGFFCWLTCSDSVTAFLNCSTALT